MKKFPRNELIVSIAAILFSATGAFVISTVVSNSRISGLESSVAILQNDYKELQKQRLNHKIRKGFWREDGDKLESKLSERIDDLERRLLELEVKLDQ